jgi:hypothetical protein
MRGLLAALVWVTLSLIDGRPWYLALTGGIVAGLACEAFFTIRRRVRRNRRRRKLAKPS